MPHSELQLLLDSRSVLAEGPLWDVDDACLWWIDIEQGLLHRLDPASGSNETQSLGERIGTVVRRATGGLLLGLQSGIVAYDWTTGARQTIAAPEEEVPDHRFNDGKCDPAGRFWAGTLNFENEDLPEGKLYRLDADGSLSEMLDRIRVSNGIVWTSDRRTMYYIDSPTRRIDAFDYDHATGNISNRRTAVTLPAGLGYPDGMAIDADDHVWVALWDGWGVARFHPRTGELLEKIDVPASQVTACALGGPELRDLYITTARRDLDESALAKQPHAGSLFHCRVEIPGVATTRFAG